MVIRSFRLSMMIALTAAMVLQGILSWAASSGSESALSGVQLDLSVMNRTGAPYSGPLDLYFRQRLEGSVRELGPYRSNAQNGALVEHLAGSLDAHGFDLATNVELILHVPKLQGAGHWASAVYRDADGGGRSSDTFIPQHHVQSGQVVLLNADLAPQYLLPAPFIGRLTSTSPLPIPGVRVFGQGLEPKDALAAELGWGLELELGVDEIVPLYSWTDSRVWSASLTTGYVDEYLCGQDGSFKPAPVGEVQVTWAIDSLSAPVFVVAWPKAEYVPMEAHGEGENVENLAGSIFRISSAPIRAVMGLDGHSATLPLLKDDDYSIEVWSGNSRAFGKPTHTVDCTLLGGVPVIIHL